MFERLMRVYQEPGIMMNSNCASEVPKKEVEQKKQEGKRAAVVRVAHGEARGAVCWGVVLVISYKKYTET